ncbi:MAG: hypothetical protein M1156_00700 [Candidatus Marsarchaeota archaeon]|jgi:hypothetical protein|nr:hypothetical protein [Candidatus Marsarchaeota archaeon]
MGPKNGTNRKNTQHSKRYKIAEDYNTLRNMATELRRQQSSLRSMGRRMARDKTYNLSGLIDGLSNVMEHMGRASKEIDKAMKELKLI